MEKLVEDIINVMLSFPQRHLRNDILWRQKSVSFRRVKETSEHMRLHVPNISSSEIWQQSDQKNGQQSQVQYIDITYDTWITARHNN
jgi:hypothetical protein